MCAVVLDDRELSQRFSALDNANEIRVLRARFKRALKSGDRRLADVLLEPEWFLFSMPVYELLVLAPKVGRSKANVVLRRAEVWPLREVGRLTVRQRGRLVVELRGRP